MTRDELVAAVHLGICPSCGRGRIAVAKPKYGWGNMGAQYKCLWCGLRLRVTWSSLQRSGIARGLLKKEASA